MKKSLLVISLLLFTFSFSQSNKSFLVINFSSICCGPASEKPVSDFIKDFQLKNHTQNFEMLRQYGLGEEGEYALYINIIKLNPKKKADFMIKLNLVIEKQNKARNPNHDGYVNLEEKLISRNDLIQKKNIQSVQ